MLVEIVRLLNASLQEVNCEIVRGLYDRKAGNALEYAHGWSMIVDANPDRAPEQGARQTATKFGT